MVRVVLFVILAVLIARALWRLLDGIIVGATRGQQPGAAPPQGIQMTRDPVCGTFVVPERSVALVEGGRPVYFCSDRCRDTYRARTA
jgi:YHS domain-containing protein